MSTERQRGCGGVALGFVLGIAFSAVMLVVGGCLCTATAVFAVNRYAEGVAAGRSDRLIETGTSAPDFTVATVDGEPLSLSDLRGTPVLLSFWASWCAPCVAEIPVLDEVTDRYGEDEIVVLAVNAGETPDEVREFLAVYDVGVTFALDPEGDVSRAYGAASLPTAVLIDESGVVTATHAGAMGIDAMEAFIGQ